MSDVAYVSVLPRCDIHDLEENTTVPATVGGVTKYGAWASMCESCFQVHGIGLGAGKGQRYVVWANHAAAEPFSEHDGLSEEPAVQGLPPSAEAFVIGALAAQDVASMLQGAPGAVTTKTAYFWIEVGRILASSFPDADTEIECQFIAGVCTTAPHEMLPAAVVSIPSMATFASPQAGGPDLVQEVTREQAARAVQRAAEQIRHGANDGDLRDDNGQPVGTFTVHFSD
jgi:hypothetical protein